jgi:hypothetical protein
MAVALNMGITASTDLVTVPESYHGALNEVAAWDTPLLDLIGFDSLLEGCSYTTHYYNELYARPCRTTLNTSVSNSDTTFIFDEAVGASGDYAVIGNEVIYLDATANRLTFTSCDRAQGAASAAAHTAGDMVVIIGPRLTQGFAQGSTGGIDLQPNKVTTSPELFSHEVFVTDTAACLEQYGVPEGAFQRQILNGIKQIKKRMQSSILFGKYVSGVAFDGFHERLYTSYSTDLAGLAPTPETIETAVGQIMDYGTPPNFIAAPLYVTRIFDAWGESKKSIPVDPVSTVGMVFGTHVDVLNLGGAQMVILPIPEMTTNMLVGNTTKCGFGPMRGPHGSMELHYTPYGKNGSREGGLVQGQYVFECPCPPAHRWFKRVKVS